MVLALFVFGGLIIFDVIADHAVTSIEDKIDVSVYFHTTTSEDRILEVKQSLESLAEVKNVEYISRDRALEIFREAHSDDPVISQGLNELDENPLEASLNVKARKPDQYASIAAYLESPNLETYIDSVSYSENKVVIDRLTAIVNNVNRGGLAITVILAAIAGLIVFNTIRIAIHSNREEINVMRLVGASNALVRGPSMVEGIVSGFLGAIISLIILAPVVYVVSPQLEVFVPSLNIFQYFYTHLPQLLLYQLLFGMGIGGLSSFVAVRRYLHN
ncbi:MAG: cell division protein FtsX [bacterium]